MHTHYWEDKKAAKTETFEEIFADSIKGCAIRLIRTEKDLSTITVLSSYVYDQFPRVDKLKAEFSIDGRYLVIYSKENKFAKVYEINQIEDIISDIEK